MSDVFMTFFVSDTMYNMEIHVASVFEIFRITDVKYYQVSSVNFNRR